MSTIHSRSCWVTIWERKNEQGLWEHNHASEGFENGIFPPAKKGQQWNRGTWRYYFMLIDDEGNLTHASPSLR